MKENKALHQRLEHYAYQEITVLQRDLHLTSQGYDTKQVEKSREKYGRHAVAGKATDSIFYRLRRAFINPFTLILICLAGIWLVTDVLFASSYTRNLTTIGILLGMVLVSGMIRLVQEMRSKQVADRLADLLHSTVSVLREGCWQELPSSELVVGDRVRLYAGDRVPADMRLVKGSDLFVSQAAITGESVILEKNTSPLEASPIKTYRDYTNLLLMGSALIGGYGEGIVLAVGQDTVYGGFMDIDLSRKNGFDRGANSIAWVLIRFMIVLIPIVFIASGLTKGNWFSAFLFALSVAVGLTPEMLPMVSTACLAKGSATMGQKQTVVKNINAMQGFGSMDVLCVDKTGTLTGDYTTLEYYMDILGNESEQVLHLAYLNSYYHSGIKNHLDEAIKQISTSLRQTNVYEELITRFPKLDERPFDYERQCVSVLVESTQGPLVIMKGNVDVIVPRCTQVAYRGERRAMTKEDAKSVHLIVDEMLEDGMKVIAVAYRHTTHRILHDEDEHELILLGYLAFFDAPKKSADAAIAHLKRLHVEVKVLTGDQQDVAISICRRLNLKTQEVMTGNDFESLSDDEKRLCLERVQVFVELSPKHKVDIVRLLQKNGHTVGYLGDGMNDLPAIVESDVGISVDTAVEAVKECADVILLKKDLQVLEQGILEGRRAFYNMSKYIRITASSNFGNILSIVIAGIFLPFFPMTSIQLLLLNLLYDCVCLVLPWDHVDEASVAYPLEWSGRTLGRLMCSFGPISSLFDMLTFACLYFVFCPMICGGSLTSLDAGGQLQFISLFQTGWFLESMWTQILILHLLRTEQIPMIQNRPSSVVMLVTTLGIGLFTIMTWTPLGRWLGLTAMPLGYFVYLVLVVTAYLLLMILAKRRYLKRYAHLM